MSSHVGNLYDKLNNVHASLRKQKEDAYRTKQLAEERLRLARQDREAMEKRGAQARDQLRQLRERSAEMKGTNSKMDADNRLLEKEFNFQHSELQSKKEKLSRLEEKRNAEASGRHYSLVAAREMLRGLREESSKNADAGTSHGGCLSLVERRRKLEQAMEVNGGEELYVNLPELVRMRGALRAENAKNADMRNASLRRIIAGYQNALSGPHGIHLGRHGDLMQQ